MSKLSDARTEAILKALENGCTRRAAAGYAGIHHSTLYAWMTADPTLSDAIEKAEGKAEASFTAAIVSAVPSNWQAAAWWLERRRPEDYGRRMAIDLSIRDEAKRIAEEFGVDADEAIAEAERILAERR